jgi:hypothetical protein
MFFFDLPPQVGDHSNGLEFESDGFGPYRRILTILARDAGLLGWPVYTYLKHVYQQSEKKTEILI